MRTRLFPPPLKPPFLLAFLFRTFRASPVRLYLLPAGRAADHKLYINIRKRDNCDRRAEPCRQCHNIHIL